VEQLPVKSLAVMNPHPLVSEATGVSATGVSGARNVVVEAALGAETAAVAEIAIDVIEGRANSAATGPRANFPQQRNLVPNCRTSISRKIPSTWN
jgi:hypothetical protein